MTRYVTPTFLSRFFSEMRCNKHEVEENMEQRKLGQGEAQRLRCVKSKGSTTHTFAKTTLTCEIVNRQENG